VVAKGGWFTGCVRFSGARVLKVLRFGSFALAVMVLVFTSSGCGYALAGRGSFLPTDIRVVGIPQLVNRTTFFDVEQILTEKIRNEFIGRGKYRVVPEATGADAVLNQRSRPSPCRPSPSPRRSSRRAISSC